MRRILGLLILTGVGLVAWQAGGSFSADAMSMALGITFGIVAGIPAAILVLSIARRREEEAAMRARRPSRKKEMPVAPPPPVIIITSGEAPTANSGHGWSGQPGMIAGRPERRFRVVGENEEWLE